MNLLAYIAQYRYCKVWHYWLRSLKQGDTKLVTFTWVPITAIRGFLTPLYPVPGDCDSFGFF